MLSWNLAHMLDEKNSLKAYGPFDTTDTDDFMLTFHNSLLYYVCNMNEFLGK